MAEHNPQVPRRTRAGAWLFLICAIACARKSPAPAASPAVRSPAPVELRQRYAGTYVYVGGESERTAVAAAVDRAVEHMSFITRDFARSALKERAAVRESITIAFDDAGNVSVLSPGEFPEVSPSDGTPARVINRFGDESELSQRFVGGVLVQQGRTDSGGGSTAFELHLDGQTLLVHRVMESSHLPKPVEFTLTYRRQ
jgi:hypothetical protein